jgi:hypothetical protein
VVVVEAVGATGAPAGVVGLVPVAMVEVVELVGEAVCAAVGGASTVTATLRTKQITSMTTEDRSMPDSTSSLRPLNGPLELEPIGQHPDLFVIVAPLVRRPQAPREQILLGRSQKAG